MHHRQNIVHAWYQITRPGQAGGQVRRTLYTVALVRRMLNVRGHVRSLNQPTHVRRELAGEK